MTREEAIKILDYKTYPEAMAEIEYYGGFSGEQAKGLAVMEACNMAISALRAQQTNMDRSRWEGCKYCNHTLKNYMYINACGIEGRSLIYNMPEYCPMCGKPLTKKAWAKLERRGGGNDA